MHTRANRTRDPTRVSPGASAPARGRLPSRRSRHEEPPWETTTHRAGRRTSTSSSSAAARRASTAPVPWPRVVCGSRWSSGNSSAVSAPTGRAFRRRHCCGPGRPWPGRGTPPRRQRSTFRPPWHGGTTWCRTGLTAERSAGSPTGGSPCCAGADAWPAPGVVEVDGVRHTADHVVLANGADPIVPPIPGLRRARRGLGNPGGDEHAGDPAPADRARRWPGRCGARAGRAPPRR